MTRPRAKSFPRGQSAVPSRGLTIFWCIYTRFSIFCINVCFLKFFAQLSLIRHVYNNPERRKRATIACFFITRRVRRRFHETNIVGVPCKRVQHCCATLRRSQNNRNVGNLLREKFDRFQVVCNKCQQVPTLLWFMQADATW